tara:strand:- start:12197 stop:14296 length:2100 start_codon:yes stop_codon:yes gene_type:complete
MITGVFIGKERLELFEDESIVIKSSVAKIEDITKIFTDTSNDFTVPASDKNNAIFSHWYESNLINGFDARKKVPAVIEISGINFKVGKIRLNKVNFKHNKADSYSLDFFGNLVDLKDKLQDDKLVNLDLSALNFTYTSANVRAKLQTISDLSFSLLSKRRLLYDSVNAISDTDKQTNIYYNGNTVSGGGLKPSDLTASVKQFKIIEAIEAKYSFVFSRDFLASYDFTNQFMALSGTNTSTASQLELTNVDGSFTDPTVSGNTMLATGFGTSVDRETKYVRLSLGTSSAYLDVPYTIYIKSDDTVVAKMENVKGANTFIVNDTSVQGGLNNVTFWVESSLPIEFFAYLIRIRNNAPNRYGYNTGTTTANTSFLVSNRLPDIKIIDYLKGIFKMSKLVAVPQKDGTIYIDSLVNYYRNGKLYDLSDYVDYDSHTVNAGKILNEIKYNFEDPQTILNQQYKKNNGVGFGDLELSIYDDNGKLIDGSKLDFKLPFEQIVYEKILDISSDDFVSRIQYGLLQDENLEFVTIKPHIHYIETKNASYIYDDPGVIKYIEDDQSVTILTAYNVPIHILESSNQTFSTTFGTEFNSFDNLLISNTIYSNYHKNYIELLFNIQKREFNFKAINVPTDIVLNLNLNDVIQIKEKYYRIDSFDTNTNDNNINFKLINDNKVDLTPLLPLSVDSTIITIDTIEITVDATKTA